VLLNVVKYNNNHVPGAASLHRNRPAAYLGSIADTLPTLALLDRLAPLLDAPHTWHTSACPALRDAAAAWDYIANLHDVDGAPYLHRLFFFWKAHLIDQTYPRRHSANPPKEIHRVETLSSLA
jgi:hypothetical protein